jgi:hypothetical protein
LNKKLEEEGDLLKSKAGPIIKEKIATVETAFGKCNINAKTIKDIH